LHAALRDASQGSSTDKSKEELEALQQTLQQSRAKVCHPDICLTSVTLIRRSDYYLQKLEEEKEKIALAHQSELSLLRQQLQQAVVIKLVQLNHIVAVILNIG